MTRLPAAAYLDHIRSASARFRDVLADCDPAARVPACPDWDAADLLWHLTGVQAFWRRVVVGRPAPPQDDGEPTDRPSTYAGLLELFDEATTGLADALARADAADPAWTWAEEQTVGFTYRRQAHEALIHRLDAEQAAGAVTSLDPALAADGVAELMEVMYGGEPPAWGRFHPGTGDVEIRMVDVGASVRVRPGILLGTNPDSGRNHDGPHLVVVPDPGGEPAAVVSGAAADLDAWLWRRSDDSGISVAGDAGAYGRFRAAVSPPLD